MLLDHPYILFPLIAAVTAPAAVIWDRWYIKRLIRKEFSRQLKLELDGGVQIILRPNWRGR